MAPEVMATLLKLPARDGRDPVRWTSFERRIRCPTWRRAVPPDAPSGCLTTSSIRLVLDEGKTPTAVAGDLDLTPSMFRIWVARARAERTRGRTGLTVAEREELAVLRREVRQLRTERDILKKAAAFFAKHQA